MRSMENQEGFLERGTIEYRLLTSPNSLSPFCFSFEPSEGEINTVYSLGDAAWSRAFIVKIRITHLESEF